MRDHLAERHATGQVDAAARRLADQQEGEAEDDAAATEHEEHQLPRAHRADQRQDNLTLRNRKLDDEAAQQEGKTGTEINAHRVNADGGGTALRRKIIGNH